MAEYIEREVVDKVIDTARKMYLNDYGAVEVVQQIKSKLCNMPNADVQPVDRWISCKEKMPDDGVNVLIYAGNRMISLAWYDKDMGYFYICDSDYKYNSLDVTHWQPLPEPPKDGDTNG